MLERSLRKPEILCHPNIPKPLHGVAPREIKGAAWWDAERQKAYASTNYHCVACGVHKRDAKKHQWLEAHEFWHINYMTGKCLITSIEPLCHYCHNFIHSGRLSMIMGREKSVEEVRDILEHGFKVLSENNLEAFYGTIDLADTIYKYNVNTFGVKPKKLDVNYSLGWKDYYLEFEGQIYRSKFNSEREWSNHYKKGRGGF